MELASSGFVLTGGNSTRMGRDKGFLEIEGQVLAARIAGHVRRAAGSVALIGAPERYAVLGFPVFADLIENAGPLGGIFTALSSTSSAWNLIVACDMPGVTEEFLKSLLDAAARGDRVCLVPETSSGIHPLCAVYHREALPSVKDAIDHKYYKMQDFLEKIHAARWPVANEALLANANTPADWIAR